jgi:FeS assembly SUF system regulator
MLRMSKMTDYGFVVLSALARDEHGTRTARELAQATRVPLPSVSKVLKELSQAGLLSSHRGALGGYSLARAAELITIGEVLAALEGPIGLTECGVHPRGLCDLEGVCRIKNHWTVINRTIRHALAKLTLADLRGPAPTLASAPARSGQTERTAS